MAFEFIRSAEKLGKIANQIDGAEAIGLDLETTGKSPYSGKSRLCSLNTGQGIYVIDLWQTGGLGPVADAIRHSKDTVVVGQTLKFDQKFLLFDHDLELGRVFDTHRASAMLYNGKEGMGHDLYAIYDRELHLPPGPELGGSDWSGTLSREQIEYSAEDVTHLLDLRNVLKPKVLKAGLAVACTIEFGAILPEAAIELNGFRLDADKWMELADYNRKEAKRLEAELWADLPRPDSQLALPGIDPGFNLGSRDKILASFHKMGVKIQDTQKTTLAMVAGKYPIIKKFIEWRTAAKRLSSFGPKYLAHIDPLTGRVHCDYWPLTGAGRYSCSDPNLQQIPRDKQFRRCFTPGAGRRLVLADYSQIELRLVAEASKDPTLCEIYLRGEDAHTRTASLVSQVPIDQVTKGQRQMAKPINFGLMYGMMPEKLVLYAMTNYGVALTIAEAEKFHKRYFEGYPGVKGWHQRMLRDGKRTGMSRTASGRLRYLDPEKNYNEFFNTPIQGTGADGLKASMAVVYQRLRQYGRQYPLRACMDEHRRVFLVHMVHDELITDVDDDADLCLAVQHDIEQSMVDGMTPLMKHVPVVAEGSSGLSWADKA
jgi:DNA polymerase I